MLPAFGYSRPEELSEVLSHLAREGHRVHAGGTDLLGCLRDGVFSAAGLVSLGRLPALRKISADAAGLRIGAMATIASVAAHPEIAKRYRALVQAAAEVASPQLRNQGTLGGNLCQKPRCWYYRGEFDCLRKGGDRCFAEDGENQYHCILGGQDCFIVHPSDPAPALVALGASVAVQGPKGTRTVPVEELHVRPADDPQREISLEPGEIITRIDVPAPAAGTRSSYRKVRTRRAWDFALAGVALALELSAGVVKRSRVVLSGVAPVPWRSREAEQELDGKKLGPQVAERAARAALAKAAPLPGNAYKVELARAVVEDQLLALVS